MTLFVLFKVPSGLLTNTQPSELQFLHPPTQLAAAAPYIQYQAAAAAAAATGRANLAAAAQQPTRQAAAAAAAAAAAFPPSLCTNFFVPTASLSGKGKGEGKGREIQQSKGCNKIYISLLSVLKC